MYQQDTSVWLQSVLFLLQLSLVVQAQLSFTSSERTVRTDLRLSGGVTGAMGRLEVHDGTQWGTVCDDGWTTEYCALVCRDLGYSTGRQATTMEKASLGRCEDLPILWDDVRCAASMTSVFDCERTPGPSNCNHDEDVHCVCQGPQRSIPITQAPPLPSRGVATCDPGRHKITPYDRAYPWIGRAEVTSADGSTSYAICDDFWDDEDAQVFCNCFNGAQTSATGYRAFWKTSYSNMPRITMKYKAVHCTKEQAQGPKRNIYYCDFIENGASGCDVMKEAAGVACGPIPTHLPTPPPIVTVSCRTNFQSTMKICFESSDSSYTLNPTYLEHQPTCEDVTTTQDPRTNGFSKVCMDVNMDTCMTSKTQTSASAKTYCYDVRYSQFDRYPGVMMTDTVWNRRACCEVLKNRTVSANFLAEDTRMIEPEETVAAKNDLPFRIDCFTDESFSGPPLAFPANVTRGQDLFCKVTVSTWDEHLFLVVPTCRFAATELGTPHYEFWVKNCPRSSAMPVSYYNLGAHTWGLQFTVPLFQNFRSLYLTCGSYVCDRDLDAKPYCDRSCNVSGRRRKRSTAQAHNVVQKEVHSGELRVQDNGFGPLIMRNGTVIDIEAEMINVKVGEEVRHVAFHELELLPSQPLPQKQVRDNDDSSKRRTVTSSSGPKQHKNMTSPYGAGNGAPSQGFLVILVLPLVVIIKQIFT